MITVKCVCSYNVARGKQWPNLLTCRPMIGDAVRAINHELTLYVSHITHCEDRKDGQPYLEIELKTRDGRVPS